MRSQDPGLRRLRRRAYTLIACVALLVAGLAAAGPALAGDQAPEQCDLYGTKVSVRSADAGQGLNFPIREFAFHDADGDDDVDPGERVYLALDPFGAVQENDLRLTGPAGTLVAADDSDHGDSLVEFGPAIAVHDANANFARDGDETVYLDSERDGVVNPGDVRVTPIDGDGAGEVVTIDDPDVGGNLIEPFAELAFLDADADAQLTPGDIMYLDMASNSQADPGDVRLGGRPIDVQVHGTLSTLTHPQPSHAGLTAEVVDRDGGPVRGLTVFFYVDGDLRCSGTTDADGEARCGSLADAAQADALGYEAVVEPTFPFCGGTDATAPGSG